MSRYSVIRPLKELIFSDSQPPQHDVTKERTHENVQPVSAKMSVPQEIAIAIPQYLCQLVGLIPGIQDPAEFTEIRRKKISFKMKVVIM